MTCPICQKETHLDFRPFCSKRCTDVDLAKWLGGAYAIPSNDPEDADALMDALDQAARSTDEDDMPPRLS